ncbi:hypothetical protein [Rhodobacter sp. NSM]|uniref:hypothetical protein n=1 Tax=Rhodobacter sp. NSM TaxID=3457501 RepID=UPI003FD23688
MPIRLQDLAHERATLMLRCRQCGRVVHLHGDLLVKRFGGTTALSQLLARLRCEKDGMLPDAVIVLDSLDASREAMGRPGVSIHPPMVRWID